MQFRSDINGLRAIAVLAVLIFHFSPSSLPGGFAGVDVFFVVSGFLMTAIVAHGISSGTFSLWRFYADRARRIAPALLFLCVALVGVGWFVIWPSDYRLLGRHVLGAVSFVSNFMFWSESGYFDSSSLSKWLLHTWSLSVEWQFYICYPFILTAFWGRASRLNTRTLLLAVTALSFAASIYFSKIAPSFSYYLLPARFWEFSIGGLIALYPVRVPRRLSAAAQWIGISGIMASMVMLDSSTPWPGYGAALPVLGAILVIAANRNESFWSSNKLTALLGKSSYSIYLWHWPICVYMRGSGLTSNSMIASGIAMSLLAGILSYLLIEKRLTEWIWPKSRTTGAQYVLQGRNVFVGAMLAALLGGAVYIKDGFSSRYSSEIGSLAAITDVYGYFGFAESIRHGVCHSAPFDVAMKQCMERREKMLFLWGDSFAAALYPGLKYIRDKEAPEYGIAQMTDGNGPPFLVGSGLTSDGKTMPETNGNRLKAVEKHQPEVIVISWFFFGANSIYDTSRAMEELERTVSAIREVSPNSRILVAGPPPVLTDNLIQVVLRYWKENQSPPPRRLAGYRDKRFEPISTLMRDTLHSMNVEYISVAESFCDEQGCLTRIGDDIVNLPLVDGSHLSKNGSIYLLERIWEQVFISPSDR